MIALLGPSVLSKGIPFVKAFSNIETSFMTHVSRKIQWRPETAKPEGSEDRDGGESCVSAFKPK